MLLTSAGTLLRRLAALPTALKKILKALQRKAKMQNIGELSGHSFRVGAAVDLLDRGVPFETDHASRRM